MARARISRMLCLDPPDLGEDEAWQLAEQLATAFESRVAASIERVVRSHPIERGVAVISGRGEFAAQRALERVTPRFARVESLAEKIGEPSSVAACAFALVHLATTPDG